jgi:hypothetical protein
MVPSGLENRHVTPADVARSEGEEAYLTYIQALKLAGFDVTEKLKKMAQIIFLACGARRIN